MKTTFGKGKCAKPYKVLKQANTNVNNISIYFFPEIY